MTPTPSTLLAGQVPLFDALAEGHVVTVGEELKSYIVGDQTKPLTWYIVVCSCGYTTAGKSWSSHRDLAEGHGQRHAEQAAVDSSPKTSGGDL